MKRLVFALIFAGGLAHASVTCTNPNTLTGETLNNSVGSQLTGCLSVGGTSGTGSSTVDNLATDGLYVNPTTGTSSLFQTGGLSVAWKVTYEGSYYQYQYTFTNTAETISHINLGLGSNCTTATTASSSGGDCIYGITTSAGAPNSTVGCSSSTAAPGIPVGTLQPTCTSNDSHSIAILNPTQATAAVGGNQLIPWDSQTLTVGTSSMDSSTVTFDSIYAPVWQDVYIRDTSDYEAWNNAALNTNAANVATGSVTTSGTGFFVAAPGNTVVPEPAFYGLLALGLTGLFFVRRSSRKHSSTT
jgi:hypothetical protein